MNKLQLLFCLLFFNICTTQAQEITSIHGKILNYTTGSIFASFVVNTTTLEDATVQFDVDENGEYTADFFIATTELVSISFNRKKIELFLEPAKNMGLVFDANDIDSSIRFFEKGETQNNETLRKFNTFIGNEPYGTTILPPALAISSDDYKLIQSLSIPERYQKINEIKSTELAFYNQHIADKERLSPAFKKHTKAGIVYRHLAYLKKFVQVEALTEADQKAYEQAFSPAIINDQEAIDLLSYKMFLDSYMVCECQEKINQELNYYIDYLPYYDCVKNLNQLNQAAKESLLARLLYVNVNPNNARAMESIHEDFQKYATNEILKEKVNKRFELSKNLMAGAKVPNIELVNPSNELVSMEDFLGQKVYIIFWAKWCSNCKIEILQARENRALLKDENIKFVFISIDDKKEDWLNHSITQEQEGVHLWGGAIKNDLMRQFGIVSLPRNFLIDETGKLITDFPKSDSSDFVNFILKKP